MRQVLLGWRASRATVVVAAGAPAPAPAARSAPSATKWREAAMRLAHYGRYVARADVRKARVASLWQCVRQHVSDMVQKQRNAVLA